MDQLLAPPLSQSAALFPDQIGGQCEGCEGGDNRGHRRDGECRGVPASHVEESAGEPRHEHAPHAPRREDLAVDGREARGAIEPRDEDGEALARQGCRASGSVRGRGFGLGHAAGGGLGGGRRTTALSP